MNKKLRQCCLSFLFVVICNWSDIVVYQKKKVFLVLSVYILLLCLLSILHDILMDLSSKQLSELTMSLQWRWEIPLKFSYLWEWGKNWIAIEELRRKNGWINSLEASLLQLRIEDFLRRFTESKSINIIDLWCGWWTAIEPIISYVSDQWYKRKYCPVDISWSMMESAWNYISTKYWGEYEWFVVDFESWNLAEIAITLKQNWSVNFFCFLWSTIGNFANKQRTLANFRDSMNLDDWLLIWVELTNLVKVNSILSHYSNDLVKDFLYYIPECIWFNRDEVSCLPTRNEKLNQVEVRMWIGKKTMVVLWWNEIIFEKGEQILLSRSTKYNEMYFQ